MIRKICNFLVGIIVIVLAVIAGLLIIPKLMGFQPLAVLSGSMEPTIPVGSVILVEEYEVADLKAGDVITYRLSGETLVTHRIVSNDTDNQEIITKGDANEVEDASPVQYSAVMGKAGIHFPLLGYISIYIKTPLGIAGVCAVLFVVILLTFLPECFEKKEEKVKTKN